MEKTFLTLMLLAATAVAHAKKPGEPDQREPVPPTANAHEIWQMRCQGCHKPDGSGRPDHPEADKRTPNLTSAKWHAKHSDDVIRSAILDGVGGTKMKAFRGKMTDQQVDELVKYVRSLKK